MGIARESAESSPPTSSDCTPLYSNSIWGLTPIVYGLQPSRGRPRKYWSSTLLDVRQYSYDKYSQAAQAQFEMGMPNIFGNCYIHTDGICG